MDSHWILQTSGEPLKAVRRFLQRLYVQAELDGIFVPIYIPQIGANGLHLVTSPKRLAAVDPFIPLASTDAAAQIRAAARTHPHNRYAAVLRSCEIRALMEIVRREVCRIDRWILIGVDCLAVYPPDDFLWRAEQAGGPEALTARTLRSAGQGGLAPYRFRNSCQVCTHSWSEFADLNIGILGMPVRQQILISAKDLPIVDDLDLGRLTDGPAPEVLVERHARVAARIQGIRARSLERVTEALPAELPADVDGVVALLKACDPCRACMEACPLCSPALADMLFAAGAARPAAADWLSACVGCGMCEDACPEHRPLTAVFGRIRRDLNDPAAIRTL